MVVCVNGADDDSGVERSEPMQSYEVSAVERQYNALLVGRVSQQVLVGNLLIGPARLERCQDVMAEATKLLNYRLGEVFVRIESQRSVLALLGGNGFINFLRTIAVVG